MLTAQRRELLLDRLRRDGRIVAAEIAGELEISEDTIRRDLRELAAAGLLQRVYGGALPASPAVEPYDARTRIEPASKHRIAAAAARLIEPGATVLVDGGTTALALVDALPRTFRATVITHSPTVAVALAEHAQIELQLIGGKIFRHSMVASGALAVESLRDVRADLFFLGVTGVHAEAALTTGDAEEAAMKRALARAAAETYVLASIEKIGAASPYRVLPLDAVTGIIADADPESAAMRELARAGARLVDAR